MSGKGLPRGIRNNNPGNLEMGSPWQGLTKTPQDNRFCSFITPAYGIRALAVTLITYHDKRKAKNGTRIDTVREVIDEGLRLAGIIQKRKTVAKVPVTKETVSATVTASLGAGQIANVMPQVSDALVKSEIHLSSGSVVRILFGVATIAVACVIAYSQIKRHKLGI